MEYFAESYLPQLVGVMSVGILCSGAGQLEELDNGLAVTALRTELCADARGATCDIDELYQKKYGMSYEFTHSGNKVTHKGFELYAGGLQVLTFEQALSLSGQEDLNSAITAYGEYVPPILSFLNWTVELCPKGYNAGSLSCITLSD